MSIVQFEQAKRYFLNGHYQEAEQLLLFVQAHAASIYDQTLYVDASIWLNRIFINTMRYEQWYEQLLLLSPLASQYASDEELYLFRGQTIVFHAHYFIGDTLQECKQFLEELAETPYTMLYFVTSLNLLYSYLEKEMLEEAFAIYEKLLPLTTLEPFPHRAALYMHAMYGFVLYYEKRDYAMCATILHTVETEERMLILDSFSLTYDVAKIMLEAQHGNIHTAKKKFATSLQQNPTYFRQLPLHLKLWIRTLEEHALKDDIIACQRSMIAILQQQYASEIVSLRKEMIEHYSKQFYEMNMYQDQMTGAKNRNFFEGFLEKVGHVRTYCVAVLDIDRFKAVNDTFGHAIGDEAIQCIANQLLQWQPRHDIHIIRYGGDEFVLLMPYSLHDMKPYIVQLHAQLMTTHCETKDGHSIPLSVSIGICYNESSAVDLQMLFEQADAALYQAKQTRGVAIYKPLRQLST